MAKLIASRTAQYPLAAEFKFTYADTMTPAAGGDDVDFGATNTASSVVMVIPLPPGATVTGGSVDTTEAFDAGTYNISIGDTDTADRYLAATDCKDVGTNALVPTGYMGIGENVTMTFVAAGACTTGAATVRVEYVVAGRDNEVQIA